MKSLPTLTSSKFTSFFPSTVILLLACILLCSSVYAQDVYEEWVKTEGSQNFFVKSTAKTDANRNVYQAGATITSNGDYDVLVTKYGPSGIEHWTQTFDNTGFDDGATDIYLDTGGNIYIAGASQISASGSYATLILKYSNSGALLWSDIYSHPNSVYNVASGITSDGGNVYLGGATFSFQNQSDYLALSYSSSGSLLWSYAWDNLGMNDAITSIYNSGGKLYVAGGTEVNPNKWNYCVQTLDYSTGNLIGQIISGGTGDGIDRIADLSRDDLGNIYVTGGAVNSGTGFDFRTLKLDSTLNVVWSKSFNSSGAFDDMANSVTVDNSGNVYVTGHSQTAQSGTNYSTVKYSANGTEMWFKTYDGLGNAADTAKAITLDAQQNIIVTGTSFNGANEDVYTVKYDANGNEVWNITYNNESNGNDTPSDIIVDNEGDIVIAGQNGTGQNYKYFSLKYKEATVTDPFGQSIPTDLKTGFTINKGQINDLNGNSVSAVKYYGQDGGANLFLSNSSFSYILKKGIDTTDVDSLCRFDLTPVNANAVKPYHKDASRSFQNFYLPHVPDGRERIHNYESVVYPELWSKIDLTVNANNGGANFYYVLKKGAKKSNLKFQLTGQTNASINGSGQLQVSTECGFQTLPAPEAYQIGSSGQIISLSWSPQYILTGNTISFSLGTYDTNIPLVIAFARGGGSSYDEQGLCWSTYFSGFGSAKGKCVEYNDEGLVFGGVDIEPGSFAFSNLGTAPYTSTNFNTAVFKLNANYSLNWMSYFGGSNQTIISDFAISSIGNIYSVGSSSSDDLIIEGNGNATNYNYSGNGQAGANAYDGIVFQYNGNSGSLEWSTYLGASQPQIGGSDYCEHIAIDSQDIIYITGVASSSNFPQGTGNSAFNGGPNDVFLTAFTSSHTLSWTRFIGGSGAEQSRGLQLDEDGNIWIKGVTFSSDFQLENPNPNDNLIFFDDVLNGLSDDFLAQINSQSQTIMYSTYLGGDNIDTKLEFTLLGGNQLSVASNKLYAIGQTKSSGPSFPLMVDNGDFNFNQNMLGPTNSSSSSNGYIFGLNRITYHQTWGTFMNNVTAGDGSDAGNIPLSVQLKTFENDTPDLLIIGGQAAAPNELSSGAASFFYNSSPSGGSDGLIYSFISSLSSNFLSRSTFFGGIENEKITDLKFNDFDEILFTGDFGSNSSNQGFPLDDNGGSALFSDNLYLSGTNSFFSVICDEGATTNTSFQFEQIEGIIIYPNPTRSSITVASQTGLILQANIYDISGRQVLHKNISGLIQFDLDCTQLMDGTYILEVKSKTEKYRSKFIKQ